MYQRYFSLDVWTKSGAKGHNGVKHLNAESRSPQAENCFRFPPAFQALVYHTTSLPGDLNFLHR